jgi:hypothetical protein
MRHRTSPSEAAHGHEARAQEARAHEARAQEPHGRRDATREIEDRWKRIQASFVDDPRRAVEQAAALVRDELARATERVVTIERRVSTLAPGDAATEELRLHLKNLHRIAEDIARL